MASQARSLQNDPHVTAAVDKLIHELQPLGRPVAPTPAPGIGAASAPAITVRPRARLRHFWVPTRAVVVRACVALGVLLAVAITQWPYTHGCGWGLSFYLFAVGTLVIAGLWGLLITWNSNLPFSHGVALLAFLAGLAFMAEVVLPRVGYAKAQATWTCPLPPPSRPPVS